MSKIKLEREKNDKPLGESMDEEVIKLTLRDPEYFSLLVDKYDNKLRHFVSNSTNVDSDELDDIMQDIYIKLFVNLHKFETDKLSFKNWVYLIARNHIYDLHRKKNVRPEGNMEEPDEDGEDPLNLVASEHDTEREINNKIKMEKLEKALDKIKPKFKEVLDLKYFQDKDYKEIAEILGKPEGTIASMINTAKRELKKHY